MTKLQATTFAAIVALVFAAFGFIVVQPAGAAFPNLFAKVASSSAFSVGTSTRTLFSARDNCASRVVSTVAQPIMLSFDPNITPSASVGHLQAASSSVVYDAELYGCGAVTVYGFNASTTITRTEMTF